ncbi:MAG: hypothetical protein LBH16_02335 [Treponema sp.]|jgi:hypothetical protein|nr:hypothetical protein [Treponema sp.]
MGIISVLKPVILIYECVRIVLLAVFAVLQPGNQAFVLVLAAPGALFPLMALFIWLDISRYKEYLPLLSAGKLIGVFTLMGWLIIFRQFTILEGYTGALVTGIILLNGDLLSLAAVFIIFRRQSAYIEKPVLTEAIGEPETEVK